MNIDALESYRKVIALEKEYKDNTQLWYVEGVKQGKYTFLAKGESNWDYYINKDNKVYSISKIKGAYSSYFGDMSHYKRMKG